MLAAITDVVYKEIMRNFASLENRLIDIGRIIETNHPRALHHPKLASMPEWLGADVAITSNFAVPESGFMGHDLLVRTNHAKSLTWLFFEVRDAFGGELDSGNKYGFYGRLAEAALSHLSSNQPESEDPRPLLKSVLAVAFTFHAELRQQDSIMKIPKTEDSLRLWGDFGSKLAQWFQKNGWPQCPDQPDIDEKLNTAIERYISGLEMEIKPNKLTTQSIKSVRNFTPPAPRAP